MNKPTIIKMSGPPAGYKSAIAQLIKKWSVVTLLEDVYINDMGEESGSKEAARIHIYIEQTN